MTPTKEQQAVVDATSGNLKMIAYAGTGKTATFVARALTHPERSLYLAFNKSVEQEAKQRFPAHVLAKTTHALAYAAIIGGSGKYTLGRLSIFKTAKLYRLDFYMASLVHKTIDNFCNSAESEMAKEHVAPDVIGRYQFDTTEVVLDFAKKVWALVLDGKNPDFPMTHGGYLKLYQLSQPVLRYATIMLDEAQDTNPVTQDLVLRQVAHGARVFLAGDPYQQIYAWRGAVDALQKVNADPYYLTQSFRFGPEVAGVANVILSTFFGETRPLVGLGSTGEIVQDMGEPPYTFLTRTNAFLFAHASALAGRYKIYTPTGNGNGQLPLFDSVMNVYNLWRGQKQEIRDPELKLFEDYWELAEFVKTGNADPEYTVSVAVVEKYQAGVPAQIERIRQSLVPTPEQAQVTLITAHRSKGLEWDNVILGTDYRPLFDQETGQLRTVGPDRKTQIAADEVNLLYVAATRAKRRLKPNSDLAELIRIRS